MSFALTVLGDVRWRQQPVVGDRPQALLAALAARGCRPVPADELIELVWGEEQPAGALKNLQVLVSRTRSACGADAIVRDGVGYRLGAAPGEVDSLRLAELVKEATAVLDRDAALAAELAQQALALADELPGASTWVGSTASSGGTSPRGGSTASSGATSPRGSTTAGSGGSSPNRASIAGDDDGPLAELRRIAAADVATARVIQARAASRMGTHGSALVTLEAASARRPDDESLLADLLRSEAAVRGPAAALERYERYRRNRRDELGADPGEQLRRAQRDLLALDRPVRRGLRYDATALVGRDRDLDRLRALTGSSRVVSIVGAGGLGKTRLAQAVARVAPMPVVHVVELAGVSSADDVVGEVGSELGVRDSIQGRRVLTPEQRADVRARIAQRLTQSSALLVLDNCEHLVEAVAGLVAFLVSAAPDLHVLTTSRAPLGIAAEHVYLLGELETADGAELFRERAVAARPNVRLPDQPILSIVTRLDGLPLAIELAAVQVRAMSAEEIDRRLEDRFALLRGGDRSAPDRHQTLLAVIDWSWNLLGTGERRALRWLALFNDGFTLAAAEDVLGGDAVATVQGLVGQSLLSVREAPRGGVRYRMLETVREFGRLQLVNAGEDRQARGALRDWTIGYANEHGARLIGSDQFAAIDALAEEETNLADELRAAMGDGDRGALVQLLAALGGFWMIRGEHTRLLVLADAMIDALGDWRPPPELETAMGATVCVTLANTLIAGGQRIGQLQAMLRRIGVRAQAGWPISGLAAVMLTFDPDDPGAFVPRLEEIAGDAEPEIAATANFWLSNMRENAGDLTGSRAAAQRALELVGDDGGGPWTWAMSRSLLAQLSMHMGDRDPAVGYARSALPVMQRLGATDDEIQLRCLLVFAAIADGRLPEAQAELDQIDLAGETGTVIGGLAFGEVCRAELLLARGDHAAGLSSYLDGMARLREIEFPGLPKTELEPWVMFGSSLALAAHAYYASPAEVERGSELFRHCREDAAKILSAAGGSGGSSPRASTAGGSGGSSPRASTAGGSEGSSARNSAPDFGLDYPVVGQLQFALGVWGLRRRAASAPDAVRLLVLADKFSYNRAIPTLLWERIAPTAEELAPGQIEEFQKQFAGRRPAELLEEAYRAVERLSKLEPD